MPVTEQPDLKRTAKTEPVPAPPEANDCPRTLNGVRCVHGFQRDEFGRVIDDHMHLGFDADGNRVEWLSTRQQGDRFRSPRYTGWGVTLDAMLSLLMLGLILLYEIIAFYGERWNYDVTIRVVNGVAGLTLALVVARMWMLAIFVDQQASPEKFGADL